MSHSHQNEKPPIHIKNIEKSVVLKSPIHGFGLFATEDIESGEILCFLDGQTVDKWDFIKLLESGEIAKEHFIEKSPIGDVMVCRPFRTSYGFINHSETPNMCSFYEDYSGRFVVKACKDIKQGEEITGFYALKNHIDIHGGFSGIQDDKEH